jgi:hypothetical protein
MGLQVLGVRPLFGLPTPARVGRSTLFPKNDQRGDRADGVGAQRGSGGCGRVCSPGLCRGASSGRKRLDAVIGGNRLPAASLERRAPTILR